MSTIPEKIIESGTRNTDLNLSKKELLLRALAVVAVVYIFLLSIKLMGASFKLFGTGFAEQLMDYTSNPFVGLFIGILATSLVQSSSVTTSIIVGLTAGGAISVGAAVPIIMGANIGTSVTNTIVSLGHVTRKTEFKKAFEVATVHDFFNFIVVLIMFPLEIYFGVLEHAAAYLTQFFLGSNMDVHFSSPLNAIVKPVAHAIQGLLHDNAIVILVVSLVALFLALESFVKLMRPLVESNS